MTVQRSTGHRWSARIAAATVAAAAVPLFATGTATAAAPQVAATCTGPASLYDVKTDGTLWLYQNTAPTTGGATWTNIHQIGTGWAGRTLAGAQRVTGGSSDVYSIAPNGDLRLLRFNTATNAWDNHAGYTTLGTGFSRYLSGAGVSQITVDSTGTIYGIDAAGNLRSWTYNPATSTLVNPAGTVVDQAWGGYSRIFAAGPGVLYAVDGAGALYRFRLDTAANEFTEYADQVGTGWSGVQRVFSPGGDILYVVDAQGSLSWYHYNADTHGWDNNATGKLIGTGWGGVADVSATTSTCSVPQPGAVGPTAPIVSTSADPLGLGTTSPGSLPFYFWNANGTIQYAQDTDSTGTGLNGPVPLAGPGNLTGVVAATNPDGSTIGVAAVDANGKVYYGDTTTSPEHVTAVGGSFQEIAATGVGGATRLFGLDATDRLWTAISTSGSTTTAWRDLTPSFSVNGNHLDGALAAGSSGSTAFAVAPLHDGSLGYATITAGVAQTQELTAPDQFDAVAATSTTGSFVTAGLSPKSSTVYAENLGLPGNFIPVTGLPAHPLSVSVANATAGVTALASLGDDGKVYVTNSQNSATTQWAAWSALPLPSGVTAVTDPTVISSNANGADLAFTGSDGAIYHFTAPAPAAGGTMVWSGRGHTPAK
jgi:hypothetical protein